MPREQRFHKKDGGVGKGGGGRGEGCPPVCYFRSRPKLFPPPGGSAQGEGLGGPWPPSLAPFRGPYPTVVVPIRTWELCGPVPPPHPPLPFSTTTTTPLGYELCQQCYFLRMGKIMIVLSNYAEHHARNMQHNLDVRLKFFGQN